MSLPTDTNPRPTIRRLHPDDVLRIQSRERMNESTDIHQSRTDYTPSDDVLRIQSRERLNESTDRHQSQTDYTPSSP